MARDSAPSIGSFREPIVHSLAATEDSLVVAMTFPKGGEWFNGHFPGFPVLPGVAQLFFLRRFARDAFEDFPDVASYRRIKFRRLVRPDERVRLEVVRKGTGAFSFKMTVEGEICASGSVVAQKPVIAAHPSEGLVAAYAGDCAPLPQSVLFDLLPHRPPMTMLVDVLSVEKPGEAVAVADTSPRSMFYDNVINGIPACGAIEYMAQTMALAVGAERRRRGEDPKVGFILGARRLDVQIPVFEESKRYVTAAKCVYADNEFASFDCMIAAPDGTVVANTSLTAFQPPGDPMKFAEKMRNLDER